MSRDFDDDGPEKKRRLDPILLVFVVLVAAGIFVVVVVSRMSVIAEAADAGSAHVDAGDVPLLPPPDLAEKLDEKPVTTEKGKLMKEAMKKRAQKPPPKVASVPSSSSSGGLPDVVLYGDYTLRRSIVNKLHGIHLVDGSAHGYMLSLRADNGENGGGVYAKCSAAILELPKKKLVASLSSEADGGKGAEKQAADACAASLADDLNGWLRSHR